VLVILSELSLITRTSNISKGPKGLTLVKLDGPSFSPVSISQSLIDQEAKTARQTLSPASMILLWTISNLNPSYYPLSFWLQSHGTSWTKFIAGTNKIHHHHNVPQTNIMYPKKCVAKYYNGFMPPSVLVIQVYHAPYTC
jgi:hypothetical protein